MVSLWISQQRGFFEPGGGEVRQRHKRIALGMAVSLAIHALLLTAYRPGTVRDAAGADDQPPRSIVVRLRPLPPPRSDEPPERFIRPSLPGANTAPKKKPVRVIAVPHEPAAPAQPGSYVAQQPQLDKTAPPRFDIEAARRVARRLANQPDPSKAGTALAQFPEPPPQTQSKAARAIAAAKRRDCKDGLPGGLLAPLLLLKDKKDSGCKW